MLADFIEAIPVHLRDDLYQLLKDNWIHSEERKAYIERNQERHRKKEIEQMRRRAIMRKRVLRPEKV
ncbi:hypothetical protein BY457_11482 [Marinilabilia salmonicolor]|jgi:antibiotic biosynthesis monooxygenase (ABM) superfamily enzyme|uniref:hypothetical protein n=1 Tax=Marinilabilia salmonicolor TaxID=989 RepID=UPI000D05CE40|nr:hypothetical protein [Marinilabilia salmonicolor]PRY96698.1 hypothetical protein BY457_11482 [Marinilabilia salmonicolor]